MTLTVIKMFIGPIFTEGIDDFLFEQVVDPLLPGQGLPIPLPARAALGIVQVQLAAGEAIAAGKVADLDQYTGQAAAADRATFLGFNLMYQPGGMKV